MEAQQSFNQYEPRNAGAFARYRLCPSCGQALVMEQVDGRPLQRCPSCSRIQYHNPAPGVAVLVVDGDRFVLCRRSRSVPGAGKWNLPQGYIEFDEDWLTAARREVKEETGLEVEIVSILSVVSNFFGPEVHTLVVVPLAKVIGGQLAAGDDADEARWFSPNDQLPELTTEADRHIIERYFAAPFEGAPVDPRFAK